MRVDQGELNADIADRIRNMAAYGLTAEQIVSRLQSSIDGVTVTSRWVRWLANYTIALDTRMTMVTVEKEARGGPATRGAARFDGSPQRGRARALLAGTERGEEVVRASQHQTRMSDRDNHVTAVAGSTRSGSMDVYRSGTNKATVPFRVVSLFSGIGGFDIGFENAGFEISLQCEVHDFCRSILKKQWPGIPLHENIKELKERDIPASDVWVGGFPCQDVSLARMGHRDGLGGSRSGLFHEFARLIGEGRPGVVLLENVAGLLSSHGGRDFGTVIGTLAELGYSVGWRVLNSKNFGVPQSRQRVYIVGCHRDDRGPGQILFEPERGGRDVAKGEQDGKTAVSPFKEVIGDPGGHGPVVQSIAYCLYACSARHTGTDWSRTYVQYPRKGRVRRLTPKECEGVMSFPVGWTIPTSGSYREDDLDSLRYHALGNAVTPPVAEWLAVRIRSYLTTRREASAK